MARGPIKVGTGYIDIIPQLNTAGTAAMRAELTREMQAAGATAGTSMQTGMTRGAAQGASQTRQAVAREARDSQATLTRIERQITAEYGQQAAARFRAFREAELERRSLLQGTSQATQSAIRQTAAAEAQAARERQRRVEDSARMDRELHREQLRLAREQTTNRLTQSQIVDRAHAQALREQARRESQAQAEAQRMGRLRVQAERMMHADIRSSEQALLRDWQQGQLQRLRGEVTTTQGIQAQLRDRIAAQRTAMNDVANTHTSGLTAVRAQWDQTSQAMQRVGTNAQELGRSITTSLILPLTTAAGLLTNVGVKSADRNFLSSAGLARAGFDQKQVAERLKSIQQFAVMTPFSLEDMIDKFMQYSRNFANHDPRFDGEDRNAKLDAGNTAMKQAEALIKAIADAAAAYGVMDPERVKGAMYAADLLMDYSKLNTRSLKQFTRGTGIPIQELAKMAGFTIEPGKGKNAVKNAEIDDFNSRAQYAYQGKLDQYKAAMERWEAMSPEERKGKAKPQVPLAPKLKTRLDDEEAEEEESAAFLAKIQERGGPGVSSKQFFDNFIKFTQEKTMNGKPISGAAVELSQGSIGGKIQGLKEKTQLSLGKLFGDFDPETGKFEWTELGQRVHALVGKLDDIGQAFKPTVVTLLENFFSGLEKAGAGLQWIADGLKAHPVLREMLGKFIQILAIAAPFIIAFGILTKVIGKTGKLLGSIGGAAATAGRGARGAGRFGTQVASGANRWSQGGSFRDGYTDRRDRYRQRDQDRANPGGRELQRLQNELRDVDSRIGALRREMAAVNNVSLNDVINTLSGAGGRSVGSAARNAEDMVRRVGTQGIRDLNGTSLNPTIRNLEGVRDKADAVERAVKAISAEVGQLNGRSLIGLRAEFSTTTSAADGLYEKIGQGTGATSIAGRVGLLNGRTLSGIRSEFDQLTAAADRTYEKVGQGTGATNLAGRIGLLNGRTLAAIRAEFEALTAAADGAYEKVGQGTGATSLAGRVGLLNGRSLSDITQQVKDLRDALKDADDKAEGLDRSIQSINGSTGRDGGNNGGGKNKKFAAGGVLPGYAPGIDSIPAILSPGEAILRPEVANALGHGTIHAWNAAATRGLISRFASGGVAGRGNGGKLSFLLDALDTFNIGPLAASFGKSVGFQSAASRVGGDTSRNLMGWGRDTVKWNGTQGAGKFAGMYDWVLNKLPEGLRNLPTGYSQIIGTVAGAIAPTLGENFSKDIWHGTGNIVERTGKFLWDSFNPKAVFDMAKDLVTNGLDSVKGIWEFAKSAVTDPVGTVTDAINDVKDLFTGTTDGLTEMIRSVNDIRNNPGEHARDMADAWMSTARAAMPNTEGLFEFSEGGIVPGYSPGRDSVRALLSPGEAVLRPDAVRALGYRAVLGLNQGAKTGSLAVGDATQGFVPDAAAVEDAVTRIRTSLTDLVDQFQAVQAKAGSSWSSMTIGLQGLQRQVTMSADDMGTRMRAFQMTNSVVWTASQADVLRSVTSMQTGLRGLEGSFNATEVAVSGSMGRLSSAVQSAVRSAVSFIQAAMVEPINTKLLAPAKIPLIGDLPRYAAGGVLPGYAPGVDSVLAMLSPGESVLRPEVTRALGSDTVHALNAAAMRGNLPRFATGGVVGDWSFAGNSFPGSFAADSKPALDQSMNAFLGGMTQLGWLGGIVQAGVEKARSGIDALLRSRDEEFGTGAQAVVDAARREIGQGDSGGDNRNKYNGFNGEAWCADFISWIVGETRSQRGYWGLGGFRSAPAVATWAGAAGSAGDSFTDPNRARPGDLAMYRGSGPGSWGHINLVEENRGGLLTTIGGNEGPVVKRSVGYGNRADLFARPNAKTLAALRDGGTAEESPFDERALTGRGYWMGTPSASPGLALVGERGPELVNFRGGERVIPAAETAGLLSSGPRYEIHIHAVQGVPTDREIVRALQYAESMYSL
ncbi:CHAP domain-containing protein [Embleya hyalina]|uniref:Uncharacterized protein n=1 Tax=Embleya hyalina TaxID=516124 RepID=A0A401YZ03_9ACTN|nr:CHAP domain-containing protein [Embleya hyalina]GCD99864.1 hypothetical protein EHYA_07586 [Embleya hyalina]